MSAARVDYIAPWWVVWLHSVPHFSLRLQPVDSTFNPHDKSYQQSLLLLGLLAALCLGLNLAFLTTYLVCTCCCRWDHAAQTKQHSSCCITWTAAVAGIICWETWSSQGPFYKLPFDPIKNLLEIFDGLLEYLTEHISETSYEKSETEPHFKESHGGRPLEEVESTKESKSSWKRVSFERDEDEAESTGEMIRPRDTAHTFSLRSNSAQSPEKRFQIS